MISIFFSFRLSLPTDQSQKSSIRGEADLQLGSGCNATPNGENDSIKVCIKLTRENEKFTGQGNEILRSFSLRIGLNHIVFLYSKIASQVICTWVSQMSPLTISSMAHCLLSVYKSCLKCVALNTSCLELWQL